MLTLIGNLSAVTRSVVSAGPGGDVIENSMIPSASPSKLIPSLPTRRYMPRYPVQGHILSEYVKEN